MRKSFVLIEKGIDHLNFPFLLKRSCLKHIDLEKNVTGDLENIR